MMNEADGKIHVFISYAHEDQTIAFVLRRQLLKLRDRVSVFLDEANIPEGQEIETEIKEALENSEYFTGIGTDVSRSNFSWCGVELGYYKRARERSDHSILCLFNREVPDLFRPYKNVKVTALDRHHNATLGSSITTADKSGLYRWFERIAENVQKRFFSQNARDFYEWSPEWALESTIAVTEAFHLTLQSRVMEIWYPQKRLEIKVDQVEFWTRNGGKIPGDASVVIEAAMLSVLDVGVPSGTISLSRTWEEFQALVQASSSGGEHLHRIIEDVVLSILPHKPEAQNDRTFLAPDGNRYRVILVRHQLYGDGRRDFVLNLIETLAPVGGGDPRTTLIAAGIVLASRYRFIFLEPEAKYAVARFESLPILSGVIIAKQMLQDLQKINFDAAQEGMSDPETMIRTLGGGVEIKDLYRRWWQPFAPMEAAATAFAESPTEELKGDFLSRLREFIGATDAVNRQFIAICMRVYMTLMELRPVS